MIRPTDSWVQLQGVGNFPHAEHPRLDGYGDPWVAVVAVAVDVAVAVVVLFLQLLLLLLLLRLRSLSL